METAARSLTPRYLCIQTAYWMSFAALMGFSSVYLLGVGFSSTQIGLIIAAAGILSAVLQPAIASYADRPESPSLRQLVMAIVGTQLLLAVALLLVKGSMLLTGLLYGGAIAILQLTMPLINSLGTESINQGADLRFGFCRGMASAAYAVTAFCLGRVQERTGTAMVPVSVSLILLALLAALTLFPFRKSAAPVKEEKKTSGGLGYLWKRYPKFCLVLAGCVLLYVSHALINNFTFQILETKGGGAKEMGAVMAVCAILEMPAMFCFGWLLKKARVDFWLRICGIAFALKTLLTLLAPNIPAFYAVQILQPFGWGLISVAAVFYVNAVMAPQDAIKGQAYMTMTFTLGTVLASIAGGRLIDSMGVDAMLVFGTAAGFLGAAVLLAAVEKTK